MHKKEYILIGSVLTCEVVSLFLIAYLQTRTQSDAPGPCLTYLRFRPR